MYAFGITLEELQIYTANAHWQKQYIDRTDKKFKLQPLRKKLLLKNIGIYWNSNTGILLCDIPQDKVTKKMKNLLLKPEESQERLNYLLLLAAQSKLIQKNFKDPDTKDHPNFSLELELLPINLTLDKEQLEDIIRLLEYFTAFNRFQAEFNLKRENEMNKISEEDQQKNISKFKMYFERIQRFDKKDELTGEDKVKAALKNPNELNEYKYLLNAVRDNDLAQAVKKVVKTIEIEKQKKEIEEKANKKGGFLASFRSQPKANAMLNQEEMLKLEDFISQTLNDDDRDSKEDLSEQFKSQKILALNFLLEGANISLLHQTLDKTKEGIMLETKELRAEVELRNKGQKAQISLKEFNISLKTRYYGAKQDVFTSLMQKIERSNENSKPVLSMLYEQDPIGKETGMYVSFITQALEFVYRPVAIQRLLTFFDVSTNDEALKTAAYDQLEKAQHNATKAAEAALNSTTKSKIFLSGKLASPVIVIPFLQNGDIKSPCWIVNLGDFSVISGESKPEEECYDIYQATLSGINFKYFPSLDIYMKISESYTQISKVMLEEPESEEYSRIFNVLEDVSLNLNAKIMNAALKEKGKGKPQIMTDVEISGIHVKLNPQIYVDLIRTGEFLSIAKENLVELQENDRRVLIQGMEKFGKLYHREKAYADTVWTSYFVILKGGYLYFFRDPTDIRPTFSVYIKSGSVAPLTDFNREAAFKLERRNKLTYLAAENNTEAQKWITLINEKISTYSAAKTDAFRVSMEQFSIAKESRINNVEIKKDYNQVKIQASLVLKQLKLTICRANNQSLADFCTNLLSAEVYQREANMDVMLKIRALKMHDFYQEYSDEKLKYFISSSTADPSTETKDIDLFQVAIKMMNEDHPQYNMCEKTGLDIRVKFGYLFLNLKPDLIEAILKFILTHPSQGSVKQSMLQTQASLPASELRISKDIEAKALETKLETIYSQQDKILIKLNVEMKQFGFRLIHRKLKLCLAGGSLQNSSMDLVLKPQSIYFHGRLGSVQLLETTNYPYTIDSNVDHEQMKPFEMLGLGDKGTSLIEIDFKSYDPKSGLGDPGSKIFSFVDVRVQSLNITILMQPLLRITDFFTSQVLGLLELIGQRELNEVERDLLSSQIPKLTRKQAEETLTNPSFMSINLKVESPIVFLKPLPESKESVEVRLGDILLTSKINQNTKRFKNAGGVLEFVYTETMNVSITNIGIWRIQQENKLEMSRNFNIEVELERPLFTEEYRLVYCQDNHKLIIDTGLALKAKMSPLIVVLSKDDYKLIMKILNYNITYTDELDHLFQWTVGNKESLMKTSLLPVQYQPKASKIASIMDFLLPIHFELKLQNIGVLILEESTSMPLTMMNLHLVQVYYESDDTRNMEVVFLTHEINGSVFEKTKDSLLLQKSLLGSSSKESAHKICPQASQTVANIVDHIEKFTHGLVNKEIEWDEFQLNLRIRLASNGAKNIKLTLSEFRCYLFLSTYLSLAKFAALNNSVVPPSPNTKLMRNQETRSIVSPKQVSMVHRFSKQAQTQLKSSVITIDVTLNSIVIAIPASIEQEDLTSQKSEFTSQALALRGDINVSLDTQQPPSVKDQLRAWERKKWKSITDQAKEVNRAMRIKTNLNRFEVFLTQLDELTTTEDFTQVRKRNLIIPFSLNLTRESFAILDSSMSKLITYNNSNILLDKFALRISYKDFKLIYSTLMSQMQQLSASSDSKGSEIPSSEQLILESSLSERMSLGKNSSNDQMIMVEESKANTEEYITTDFEKMVFANHVFQISIINDSQDILTPVLEATISEIAVGAVLMSTKIDIEGKVFLSCFFYNPRCSHWEPIIEKFGFDCQFRSSKDLSPQTTIQIGNFESFQELKIDLSDQMIETIYSTTASWKADYDETKQLIKKKKLPKGVRKEQDQIDYVSPYIIKNSTGYPIELQGYEDSNEEKQMYESMRLSAIKAKIPHQIFSCDNGATTNFLVELNFDRLFNQADADTRLNANKIEISIKHPSLQVESVVNVDIDSDRPFKYALKSAENNIEKKGADQVCYLVTQYHFVDNKRVFTIYSPVQLRNCLMKQLCLRLENGGDTTQISLMQDEVAAVPFDYIDKGTLTVYDPETLQQIGSKIRILALAQHHEKKTIQIPFGPENYIVRTVKQGKVRYLEFKPPFIIKNCCPVTVGYQVFSTGEKGILKNLKAQEQSELLHLSRDKNLFIKIRPQGFWWSSETIIYNKFENPKLKSILVAGIEGTSIMIGVQAILEEQGSYKIYIYSKVMIINETLLDLIYYSCDEEVGGSKKKILPGLIPVSPNEDFNPKVSLCGDSKKIAIALKDFPMFTSAPFAVGVIGDQTAMIENFKENFAIELGINLSIIPAEKEAQLYTNVISVCPRYVLINKLNHRIIMKRLDEQASDLIIEPKSRIPLEWRNYNPKHTDIKQLCFRLFDSENKEKWEWTGTVELTVLGITNLLARSTDESEFKFIKTTVTPIKCTVYLEIEEQTPEKTSLRVQNDVEDVEILFYQTCSQPKEGFKLSKKGSVPFAWLKPNASKEIFVDFLHKSSSGGSYFHSRDNKFNFHQLGKIIELVIPGEKDDKLTVYSRVEIIGKARVLRFYSLKRRTKHSIQGVTNLSFQLNLFGIGLSLISSIGKPKHEIIYACFRGIQVALLNTDSVQECQLRIKYANIDNNSYISTHFPVLITPSAPKDLLDPASKSYFLDILVRKNTEAIQVLHLTAVKILLSGISLRVDGSFLERILSFLDTTSKTFSMFGSEQIESNFANTLMSIGKYDLKEKLKVKEYFEDRLSWRTSEIMESDSSVYIEELQIQPIFLLLSFHLKSQTGKQDDKFFVFKILTDFLGNAIANIDEAPLKLSGVKLINIFDEKQAIISKLVKKYKDEGISQVYKLVGSIDIIGNPVGLFKNISTGVVDLIDKPIQGFNQGPLEGGVGIVLGAGSLVKNTISGTFNSLNKVTGSLAGGLSSITMDEEYIAEREKAKLYRPKNLVDGLGKGIKSLASGLGQGISGVVLKPIEGAQKGGVKGLILGTWIGVSGFFLKPAAGLLDAAAHASEGIKNTATYFDEKPNAERQRFPRPFYGSEQFYRPYLATDAEIKYLLHFYNEGEFANISLLYTFDIFPSQKDKEDYYVLILSVEKVLLWSSKKEKVIWNLNTNQLEKAGSTENEISIVLKDSAKSGAVKNITLTNMSGTRNNMMIVHKLTQLKSKIRKK